MSEYEVVGGTQDGALWVVDMRSPRLVELFTLADVALNDGRGVWVVGANQAIISVNGCDVDSEFRPLEIILNLSDLDK